MTAPWNNTLLALALLAGSASAQAIHFGSGCAGASSLVPTLDTPAHPWSGQEYYIDVDGPASTGGLLIIGVDNTDWGGIPLPFDLTPVGLAGCELLVRPDLMIAFTTDANGEFRFAATGLPFGNTTFVQVYMSDIDLGQNIIGSMSDALAISGAGTLQTGDVVVTELMVNPEFAATDYEGEYIEVVNTTNFPINMEGWRIDSDVGVGTLETHFVDTGGEGLIVPAGGYAILSAAPEATNGGVATDYVYGMDSIRLKNNQVDNVRFLALDNTFLDSVEWDDGLTFPDPKGASMNLNFFHIDAAANNLGQFWCDAKVAIGGPQGNTDLGSPGQANDICN